MKLSFDDKESFKEAIGSLRFNNPPSDPNTFQPVGSSSSVATQERPGSEDIFINPSSDPPNTLLRMGSGSSMPQERSEDICFNDLSSDSNKVQ